ncbi:cation-translocating P-type ATPase [Rhizobacter sp. Root1221]|uniref:cation-translocating P-type ATPase n=1 Tax=Rhizobacter sp. Root1221 TaxID=1736433 RepID=UPI0006F38E92|nr:cation-translocating P-type ATPase [Rhizobacter sp. Root1221]KQV81197.1 haloacid dehalogenase [Rhizobacter sp. Root1221]
MTQPDPAGDRSLGAAADVAAELGTDTERGLDAAEAARRLAAEGPNTLRSTSPRPAWRRLLAQYNDPLVYLLLVAVAIALVAWGLEGRLGWPIDAIVIGLVVLLNALLGFFHEARAANAVAALARMTAATSSVLRCGKLLRIPSDAIVRGDLLVLGEGDAVGADARLLRCADLRIQEASLTGESEAVVKDLAPLRAPAALADRLNMVFKGTAVAQGTGRAVVTATGMNTEVGAIARMLDASAEQPTPLQKEVALIGRMLGIAVVVIAIVIVATLLFLSEVHTPAVVLTVLLLGVSLAVAAVPEGLPAILSVVLAMGVQRMARKNAVVKQLSSVETLGSASVICTDKTGTLTRSEMTIERVVTASGETRVTGVGYAPQGGLEVQGKPMADGPARSEGIVVLSGGSLAGNADLRQRPDGEWEIHGDPTEAAFLVAERKLGVSERRQRRFERVAEIPFSSERKMMSTVERDHEQADALVVITKGAPDILLKRCNRQRVGMNVLALDDAARARVIAEVDRLSGAALRTLAVAYRPLADGEDPATAEDLEQGLIFVGTVGMIDPPRPEAAAAIAEARRAGIRVIMITGDHPRTAARIAADLGIIEPGGAALTGADLDRLDPDDFEAAVRTVSVYARVAPAHKLRIVAALQASGNVVAMTGDGVNDAPALKAADIGVAMGMTGTEVTKEAAKMILADDNFATIVDAVREGRTLFDNIRKFLRYLLSSNMGEVLTVFLGVVGASVIGLGANEGDALILPLLATQILWINLITDSGPALAMGVDPRTEDVMARQPRRPGARAIDVRMAWGVVWVGLVMALATLLTIDLYLPGGLIAGEDDLATARTAGFTVLVLAQLFNCFNARSETSSAFRSMFVNRWLWGAIGFSVLLQVAVVHLQPLNLAFGTVPLSLQQWSVCLAMGSIVLWAGEMRKAVIRFGLPRFTPDKPRAV